MKRNGSGSDRVLPRVFVSYAHDDKHLKAQFEKNLTVLREQRQIAFWSDGEILPGEHWSDAITGAMMESHIIIFLVSTNFLASSFIRNQEVPMAMKRVKARQAVIVPVILKKTPGWQNEDWNTLQALPSEVRPVDEWPSVERGFAEVEDGLRKLIARLPRLIDFPEAEVSPPQSPPGQGDGTILPESEKKGASQTISTHRRGWMVGTAAVVAGLAMWSVYKNQSEVSQPHGPPPEVPVITGTGVTLVTSEGRPIGKGVVVLARRGEGMTQWVEPNGSSHPCENYVVLDLKLMRAASAPRGKLLLSLMTKAKKGSAAEIPEGIVLDGTVQASVWDVKDPAWLAQGFTTISGYEMGEAPAGDAAFQQAFQPQLLCGRGGRIPAGIHEIGVEVAAIQGGAKLFSGTLKIHVFETDPRDAKLKFTVKSSDKSMAAKRIRTFGDATKWDCDVQHGYTVTNLTSQPMSNLQLVCCMKARKPYDSPSAELPIVVTRDEAYLPGAVPLPPGFTASVASGNLSNLVLEPGMTSAVWAVQLATGRGGYLPSGDNEVAVMVWSGSEVVYQGFYQLDVPRTSAEPALELLTTEGKPLIPGAEVAAVVDQRYKGEQPPHPVFPRDVTLSFDVRYRVVGGTEKDNLFWMLLMPEELRPHPSASSPADLFKVETLKYCEYNNQGMMDPAGGTAVVHITQSYPLDPRLPQAKSGAPGKWIKPGKHRVRLIGVQARHGAEWKQLVGAGQLPGKNLVLCEMDLTLNVTQPAEVELGGE